MARLISRKLTIHFEVRRIDCAKRMQLKVKYIPSPNFQYAIYAILYISYRIFRVYFYYLLSSKFDKEFLIKN